MSSYNTKDYYIDRNGRTQKRLDEGEKMNDLAQKLKGEDIKTLQTLKTQLDTELAAREGKRQHLDVRTGHEDDHLIYGKTLQALFRLQKGDQKAHETLERLGVKAMQEDDSGEGGYLVSTQYIPEVLRIADQGFVETYCRHIAMSGKTATFPDLSSTVSVTWKDEEGDIDESAPVLGQVELTASKVAAFTTVSNELLQDARPDVVEFLNTLFIEAMALEIDDQIENGTGDPVSGLLTAACGYSVIMGTGLSNFSSITGTHLSEMISKLKSTALSGSRFIMSPAVFHHVRTLRDNQNGFIYSPVGGGQSGTIWGYPVTLSDKMPSSSGASTAFVLFGNFRNYLIGDRLTLSMALDPYGLFTKYQTRVRWVRRIALKIGRADGFVRLITAS